MGRRWDSVVRGAAVALGRLPGLSDEARNFADFHALSRSTTLAQVQSVFARGMAQVAGREVLVSLAPNVDVLKARRLAMGQLVLARFHELKHVTEVRADYRYKRSKPSTVTGAVMPAPGMEAALARHEPLDAVIWYDAHRLTPQAGNTLERQGHNAAATRHSSDAARAGLAHLIAHENGHAAMNETHWSSGLTTAEAGRQKAERIVAAADPELVERAKVGVDTYLQGQREALAELGDDELVAMERQSYEEFELPPPGPGRTGADIRAEQVAALDRQSQGDEYLAHVSLVLSAHDTGLYSGSSPSERDADNLADMEIRPEAAGFVSREIYAWYQETRGRSADELPVAFMHYDGRMVGANDVMEATPEYQAQAAQVWSSHLPPPTPQLPDRAPAPAAALGLADAGAPGGHAQSPGPAPDQGQAHQAALALEPRQGE